MLVGHIAVGLAAHRAEPRVSLGTFVLAAMLADFLWCGFMLAGIERVEFIRGQLGAARYLNALDIGWSHSLLMDLAWAAAFGAAYLAVRRVPGAAALLFAAVASHWLLDFVSHTPDMPLAPGAARRFGLGLWTSVPWTLVVEGGMWLIAIGLYVRANRRRSRVATIAFWIGAALLTLIWYNNIAGPPPPNPRTAPVASLVFFSVIVLWAYWMNRARRQGPPVQTSSR